ncbi:hypothetical protein R1flu_011165 [Riccia fluitans]|uniref:Uncharacterized protein n=1 Tax=Riccia fluitans TaxID=41844 RepID=A0ABD1Z807_9MARC
MHSAVWASSQIFLQLFAREAKGLTTTSTSAEKTTFERRRRCSGTKQLLPSNFRDSEIAESESQADGSGEAALGVGEDKSSAVKKKKKKKSKGKSSSDKPLPTQKFVDQFFPWRAVNKPAVGRCAVASRGSLKEEWTAITAEIVTHLPRISILHYTAVCFVLFHIRSADSSATRRGGKRICRPEADRQQGKVAVGGFFPLRSFDPSVSFRRVSVRAREQPAKAPPPNFRL